MVRRYKNGFSGKILKGGLKSITVCGFMRTHDSSKFLLSDWWLSTEECRTKGLKKTKTKRGRTCHNQKPVSCAFSRSHAIAPSHDSENRWESANKKRETR